MNDFTEMVRTESQSTTRHAYLADILFFKYLNFMYI